MTKRYFYTEWSVNPGEEEEFVRRFAEFSDWCAIEGLALDMRLLRDVDRAERFVSVGTWASNEAIARWRTVPGFSEHAGRLGEVVTNFDAHTLVPIPPD